METPFSDRDEEIQLLRQVLIIVITAFGFVTFALVTAFVLNRNFLTTQLRVANLANASNTQVIRALDEKGNTVVDWETLVRRLPPVDEAATSELWRVAVETTPKLQKEGGERKAYHPVLLHVLRIITASTQGRLRLHQEATIALDGREPDMCWTPEREAYVTGVSTLPIFEVKTIKAALDAAPQLHSYMYHSLDEKQKLLPWWSWLMGWSIALYGAGCTALNIRFESLVSTRAGVELRTTTYMPFLPWVIHPQNSPARLKIAAAGPTTGFCALVRILLAPPALLGQVRNPHPPLQSMRLEGEQGEPVKVVLGDLLGGGSYGNAFRGTFHPPAAAMALIDAVVKIYRDPFQGHLGGHKQLRTELRCLRAVLGQRCKHLPVLLAASPTALLESPCGIPLPVRLSQLAATDGREPPQHRAEAAPRDSAVDGALARGVYDGILRGLQALHGIGWLHCDVRLPNCVTLTRSALGLADVVTIKGSRVTESAVLIDLGCALLLSEAPSPPDSSRYFKVPESGHTFWHDLRGALAVFVETAIGGRYSLPSALWGTNVLDDNIVRLLQPTLAGRVAARRDYINDQISSVRRRIQQAGRKTAQMLAPVSEDYTSL